MQQRIPCGNCGGKIAVPAGHIKAKIRCNHCGYYAEVPEAMRSAAEADAPPAPPRPVPAPVATEDVYTAAQGRAPAPIAAPQKPKARPRVDARDTRPEFLVEEGTGPPLLDGTREEDDDRPYAVPGTGLRPCPHCRTDLPLDATFCVHCGEHLAAPGKGKPKRTFQPLVGIWFEGWTWETRVGIAVALQVVNILLIALNMSFTGQGLLNGSAWMTNLSMNLINVFLQLFLVGTYDGFRVERTEKGKAVLTTFRRIAFVKLPPGKVKWKQSSGAGVLATHAPGMVAWFVFLYLLFYGLMPAAMFLYSYGFSAGKIVLAVLLTVLGMSPGIGFYWMVIRPEQFSVALCDEYRCLHGVLFRSKVREQAVEAAKMLTEATRLRYHEVL